MLKDLSKSGWVALIALCLSGLLVFQFFWLRQVYQDEENVLRKELSVLLEKSTTQVRDSVLRQFLIRVEKQHGDSLTNSKVVRFEIRGEENDTTPDSARLRRHLWTQTKDISIAVTTESIRPDSTTGLEAVLFRIPGDTSTTKKHRLHEELMRPNTELILESYKRKLRAAGFPFQASIQQFEDNPDDIDQGFMIQLKMPSERRPNHFAFSLTGVPSYILRAMMSQFLFSTLLFALTAFVFFLLYRNMIAQKGLIKQKDDFIHNITHELKTPIATVGAALEALESFNALDDPKKTRSYLQISKLELKRLSLLVERVLNLSLHQRSTAVPKAMPVDLFELAQQVIPPMELQAREKGGQLEVRYQGEQFDVKGDKLHLSSVLFNLLDNALKYGGKPPKIEVDFEEQPDKILVRIKDNGEGVPAAYRQQIFDKFFRVPNGSSHEVKGHGLGLSYVRQVVQQHQGDIQLEQTGPEGTTFTLSLPKQ